MSIISLNIKKLRKEKNLSQKQLASELGVTSGSIANYENEVSEPAISKLLLLCKILDVSMDELVGVEPQRKIVSQSAKGMLSSNNYAEQGNISQQVGEGSGDYASTKDLRKLVESQADEIKFLRALVEKLTAK